MNESLDAIVEKPSLSSELKEQIKNYPKNWVEYMKSLAPALIMSTVGAAAGPEVAKNLGYNSEFASLAASYLIGYPMGYTTAFSIEYFRNRKKYGSIFSKEFGKYVYTFLASDYITDITVFQTTMLGSNFWLKENTELSEAARKAAAWLTGGFCWISAMAGMHPIARRVNEYINTSVKNLYHKFKDKKDIASPM